MKVVWRSIIGLVIMGVIVTGLSVDAEAQKKSDFDWHYGPYTAKMKDIAEVRIPARFVFLDGKNTRKLMEAMGNVNTNLEVGMMAPEDLSWFVVFEFSEIGYVKDDEKDKLDPDVLMKSIREGTEEANKIRKKRGFAGLRVLGWETEPNYNEYTHNLEWATSFDTLDGSESGINHNIRILGREGVMSATLVADKVHYETVLPEVDTFLEDFAFQPGQKYEEYRKGDKLAKYGLTALVAGGAAVLAAKTGLLKYLWKFLVFIAVGIGAFFKKLFGKKSNK